MPHRIQSNQKGFTLHEMLLVVAISIILLAVSVVGILTYMRQLRLTELDNSAKEIFLAAQNRAILLRSSQQLDGLVIQGDGSNTLDHVNVIPNSDDTTQITAYYIHCNDASISQLLPDGSIDPTLWEGDFYITYEPESGSVIDVFFCDKDLKVEDDGTFAAFYETWRAASRDARMNRSPMVGYYGGESAESGTSISLRTPVINIYNEDTLRAEVTYWVPRTLEIMHETEYVQLDVKLTYQGIELDLKNIDAEESITPDISYIAYTYTWTLDSLNEDEMQFYELFSSFGASKPESYGEDFTITAEVFYEHSGSGLTVNGARKTATNNSLFAEDSGGQTAYIACLRHLQNLDTAWSQVQGKTEAVQTEDIQKVEDYTFQPIENQELNRYNGGEHAIYDLNIGSGDQATGLFGAFSGTADTYKTLEGIRLVNTTVTGTSTPTGALVGDGSCLNLTNCQVYWENRSQEATNLRDTLGNSDDGFKYQVTGSGPAGGLAGRLSSSSITSSSASTLVESSGPVGGLVGEASGLTVEKSYAASYLSGPAAAGLVGNVTGNTQISGSYAVGFIESSEQAESIAAGLCLGAGQTKVSASYSAMLFTAPDEAHPNLINYPLCQTGSYEDGSYVRTYYLASDSFGTAAEAPVKGLAQPYSTLIDSAQWNDLFGKGVFTSKTLVQSHPYNLQTTLSLTTYIYPGLADLDHWGDWGAQFQNGSLVYYEIYDDNTYGFYGGSLSHLSDDKTVIQDGYAVAYRGTEFTSSINMTLSIRYQTAEGEQTVSSTYAMKDMLRIYSTDDANNSVVEYYILPLPEQIVNSDYAHPDFYQKITIQDTRNGEESDNSGATYYYSPHFANTVIAKSEITSEADLAARANQLQVEVRTPRHLYMLSRFGEYYASTHQYRFLQQLDLDYGKYTGYDLFQPGWSQNPIGLSAAVPFRCSYYGNHHRITGVVPAVSNMGEKYQYVGLFGYTTGVLQDIVYEMQEDDDPLSISQSGSSSTTLYAGSLAGYNSGTISNCAAFGVRLQANGFDYSTLYLGGLVGRNQGTIRSSAVEGASIIADTSMSNAYAGGFVGDNSAGSYIDQCYAVGKVSVTRARHGTVYACGFAGHSSATLSRSYAAVYLLADGGAQRFGFCPDSSLHCVYLNDGNFTYRGENYVAQYTDASATPVTWEALAGQADASSEELQSQVDAVAKLGMGRPVTVYDSTATYPYPGTVTWKTNDGPLQYIHYGQWPDRMELGTMGVYYWEKLSIDGSDSYHISAISLMADDQVMKSTTLSTAHGDGGVVTEYGYGYFTLQGQILPSLTSERIGYLASDKEISTFKFQTDYENGEANTALSDLMGGKYTFHSFNTWDTATDGKGLYVNNQAVSAQNSPPVGTWTLAGQLTVNLNPFFADAMSYPGSAAGEGVPTALPGTEKNAYEVRSIDQLQFINWNNNAMNTIRHMDTGNMDKFPYLCYGSNGSRTLRPFYWEQTHDLKGETDKTYPPIAGVYDADFTTQPGGNLFGWFGGTYDGKDYVIADVNIAPATPDDGKDANDTATSCVGLFGAVYDGTLKNIVLYSESGTASVTGDNSGTSQWYVIGGLAGLAGSSTGSAVVNCTVSGYRIQDYHSSNSKEDGWGGTGVGGLIGICDMNLEGCTAVTNIIVDSKNSDNVRIGGLVGSCQGSISSSYTGGSIQVSRSTTLPTDEIYYNIYVGGIVGGIYMKPLRVGGSTYYKVGHSSTGGQSLDNTLNNCYTYMELPSLDSHPRIKGLYAVGGSGELDPHAGTFADYGQTYYNNNYYLESVVLKNNQIWMIQGKRNDLNNVTSITYAKMADTVNQDGLLYLLNSNGAHFSPVTTTTASGNPLSGRYSFGSDDSLLGLDYPFPTILTQSSDLVDSGKANVHYGNWPLAGIRRDNGALPVNLDLFADYKEEYKKALHTETLSLEGIAGGGIWTVKSGDESIATATLSVNESDRKTLSITALAEGSTTVTVTYQLGDDTYPLDIDVNVTAELRLAVTHSPVTVFTNETVQTQLVLKNNRDEALVPSLESQISLDSFQVERDPDYFTSASVSKDPLTLTAESKTTTGNTQMTVSYRFTYLGHTYQTTSSIALRLVEPEIELTPVSFSFPPDNPNAQTQPYTAEKSGFKLSIDGTLVDTITNLTIVGFQQTDNQENIIWVTQATDDNGTELPGTLSIEASPQTAYPVSASVRIQFQFTYDDSIHTLWKDLEIRLNAEGSTEGGQP